MACVNGYRAHSCYKIVEKICLTWKWYIRRVPYFNMYLYKVVKLDCSSISVVSYAGCRIYRPNPLGWIEDFISFEYDRWQGLTIRRDWFFNRSFIYYFSFWWVNYIILSLKMYRRLPMWRLIFEIYISWSDIPLFARFELPYFP